MKPGTTRMGSASAITRLVPYAHVADVDRSLAFYALLGLRAHATHAGPDGRVVWAHATSGEAGMMLARASGPIAADQQAVLFYVHCTDVSALRAHLLAAGVHDGGVYTGQAGPNKGRSVVFAIAHPFYMPAGELRVHDPDGYVLLIGQPA